MSALTKNERVGMIVDYSKLTTDDIKDLPLDSCVFVRQVPDNEQVEFIGQAKEIIAKFDQVAAMLFDSAFVMHERDGSVAWVLALAGPDQIPDNPTFKIA